MNSPNQITILKYAQQNGNSINKRVATELLQHRYYRNAGKYVGEVLKRMVDNGQLQRVKRGEYKLNLKSLQKGVVDGNEDQLKLF